MTASGRAALLGMALLGAGPAVAATWETVSALLAERCVLCHSGPDAPLGLVLDSHAGVMAGSENGPVVDTAAPMESRLMLRLTGRAEPRMPLDGPPFLDEGEVAAVSAWIGAGAPGPEVTEPAAAPVATPDPRADGRITFGEVEHILKQRCIECHSGNSRMDAPPEGLSLTSRDMVLKGGDRIVVVPGNPLASEVFRRVAGLAEPRMPLDGPPFLDEGQIALLRDWIAGGAQDDAGQAAALPVGGEIRFRGILTSPDAIDGAAFVITVATRIDDRPATGQRAELRGRIMPDGTIEALRLRGR